jgi:integrase
MLYGRAGDFDRGSCMRAIQGMFAVLAASGLRIGEILGLKIENVRDGGQRLVIVEKNWKGMQQDFLKTINGERTVELHSSVAAMLREHIGDRTAGFVFPNKKGKAQSQTNIIRRYLHPILLGNGETPGVTGTKAGNHAFRRYRNSYLRTKSCPAGLLKYWLGHACRNDMSDVYDKSPEDFEWRAEMAEQLGMGFSLPIFPECTEITKKGGSRSRRLSS